MSPMEKLEEIVRALESLTEELAAEIEGRYASTKDHPAMERRYRADMEDVEVGRRALTLARELRDNAVEGGVQVACPGGNDPEGDPYECDPPTWHKEDVDLSDWECGGCGATVDGRYGRKFIVSRALLILSEPTP